MSNSDRRGGAKNALIVEAPLGVEISIANSAFQEVASGVSYLEKTLDEGVYTVRTTAAGNSEQQIVLLRPDETKRLKVPAPQTDREFNSSRLEAIASQVIGLETPSTEAAIAFLVYHAPFGESETLPSSLRLRLNDVQGESLEDWRRPKLHENMQLLWQPVTPGVNSIAFETFERRILWQTVYAPRGRHTIVLLRVAQGAVFEHGAEQAKIRKRWGIDPSRTMIVSIPMKSAPRQLAENTTTAEILLHFLRVRPAPINEGFVTALTSEVDDPYLQLYSAVSALAAPGAPLERLAAAVEKGVKEDDRLVSAARRLTNKLSPFDDWPDVACLRWRLESCGELPTISNPPSLEICWRWAAAASATPAGHAAVAQNVAARVDAADPSGNPWLVLKAGPKSRRAHEERVTESDLKADLHVVADLLRKVAELPSQSRVAPGERASLDLERLSPTSESITRAVLSAGGARSSPSGKIVSLLAASLGSPASSLGPALRQAAAEIASQIELKATIDRGLWSSDPNKGRFGGEAAIASAAVRLESFDEQEGLEFLALRLLVEGPNVKGPVTFHLHPTFSPSVQQVFATNGTARFTCYAWGAFTLGVELSNGAKLELDLSELPKLPEWFRAR